MMNGDSRTPRHETPQYQNDEDRRRAEENSPEACVVCEISA